MSDPGVVGKAFVEVHARAAASLEREMQQEVNKAAARVQPPNTRTASFDRANSPEGQASSAALLERIAKRRAAAEGEVEKQAKKTGQAVEAANDATVASSGRATSSFARQAAAASVVTATVATLTATLRGFIQAGDEGRLKSEADIVAYRRTSAALDQLGEAFDKAQIRAARFLVENVNPASADFRRGLLALQNPLDTLAAQLGISTAGSRDLARRFAEINDADPSETLAEAARRVDALTIATERAQKAADARTEATVRAVGIEFEQLAANERLWKAQERVNETRARGARNAQALADAERSINEARQAAADAAQDAIEKDRAVEEAKRKLRDTAFRTGSGSQATLDAADAVQEAEFDARRAHEEAGDAVAAVAKAEREAADLRVKASDDQREAEEALEAAKRASARTSADLQIATREAAGETVTATEKLAAYLKELDKFGGAGGRFKAEIDIIREALASLLPAQTTAEQANAAIQAALAPGGGFAEPAAAPAISPVPQQLQLGPGLGSVTVYQTFNNQANPQVVAADTAWLLQETAAPLTRPGVQ